MKIVLKNGKLFEQTHPLHRADVDILVENHIITDIALTEEGKFDDVAYDECIDLHGWHISAGWIDLHVHCFAGGSEIGTAADKMGVAQGVPVIVDAGTAGANNMDDFVDYLATQKTKVFSLINIASSGLQTLHELRDLSNIDEQALKDKVKQYPEFIRGIKVRESGSVVGENGVQPLVIAKKLAQELTLPVMAHIGNGPPALREVIELLGPGDIMTHCYHGKKGCNIIDETTGQVYDFVRKAQADDVIFDIGHGSESFTMAVARQAIAQDVLPDTISTDMYWKNMDRPVRSLAVTMDKIIEAGIGLDDVINKVTKNPAHALHIEDVYGTIARGRQAVFTMFEVSNDSLEVEDSSGEKFEVSEQIETRACFIAETLFIVDV